MALSPYQQLEQEFKRLHAFRSAASILRWDSAVMMPRGSSDLRGEQLAALETESHALLTSPRVSRLLARAEANSAGLEDWQSANLREMRRERDQAIATPQNLVSRLAKATARQMDRSEAEERVRDLRAAPRGSREPAARQGRAARQGAQSRSVRRARR
jgi:carboxypeptidase Taq